jgi:beta-mannosidase
MFANMDYPEADAPFRASVEREAHALLDRIAHRPSLSVLCGGSEVQQQAAMLGLPKSQWESPLFDALLPGWCGERAPTVPYVPSSPSGGDLPFQCDRGISHYYGVGAYLRELDDARRADVRFAAECLAFSNIPCSETIEHFMRDLESPAHHPRWKQRVPRDRGASWDFEDVRDHYVERLFQVDARALRYGDMERYLALGRAAVGEAMESTFAEWRRAGSRCGGGLVFWLKDLWEGAGWGVIDARGRPKSAYYYLRRILAPRTVALTDEGLNGLTLHILNDAGEVLTAVVELELYRLGETSVARAETAVRVPPHEVLALRADGLLGRFADLAYAYRFGPPSHHATVVRLRSGDDVLARAFHFPLGRALPVESDLGLRANAQTRGGIPGVEVATRKLAQCVTLDVPGFVAADDYFHLEPGAKHWVALKPLDADRLAVRGSVGALNLHGHVQIAAQGGGD